MPLQAKHSNIRYGAAGVWVGTRFVASEEAGAPPIHKQLVVSAGYDDTARTLIYSGRPMSVRKTPYVASWEDHRQEEIRKLTSQGKIPHDLELEVHPEKSVEGRMCTSRLLSFSKMHLLMRLPAGLMGKVAGAINVSFLGVIDECVLTINVCLGCQTCTSNVSHH